MTYDSESMTVITQREQRLEDLLNKKKIAEKKHAWVWVWNPGPGS